jgi:flagellar basal-body rod modification protein FlgD
MSSFDTTISNLGLSGTKAPATQTAAKTTLNQADFLKLMTAQMKNQDPFNPVDNTQMVAQMAQFSSLAGITEMSGTLKAIAEKLGATSASEAASYIGRSVLVEGDTAYPRTGGGVAGAIELGEAASDVTVQITGADGTLLKTVNLGPQQAGTATYDWDGTTDAGAAAGAGPFTVRVAASNAGKSVAATGLVWAPVQSVSTTSGTLKLSLPGIGEVPASDIRQIG